MKCKSCTTALPNIPRVPCGENFGQLQLIAFVDLDDATTIQAMTAADIVKKSTWTGLMASTNAKVVVSPLLFNPTVNAGGERTWGGGNATPDGKTYSLGKEPSEITAELRKCTAAQQAALEELTCMAEADRLGCYLFDDLGQVMTGASVTGTSTYLKPLNVKKLFVSDDTLGGLEEPDYNSLSMQLPEGWSAERVLTSLADFRGADLITATVA